MWFWLCAGVIMAGAALVLGRALWQRKAEPPAQAPDLQVYRSQLQEIDRDQARGVLSEHEAGDTRLAVARKMLEADRRALPAEHAVPPAATLGLALGGAAVLASAVGLYLWLGLPGASDAPMAGRLALADQMFATRPSQPQAEAEAASQRPPLPAPDPTYQSLMAQLRATVAARPNDERGLELLARNELTLGNFGAARQAQQALATLRNSADDYAALAQIDILAAGGVVTQTAEDALNAALTRDPDNGLALYYTGLLMAQNGRPDRAFAAWDRALSTPRPDAPWLATIRENIGALAVAAGVQNYQPPSVDTMIQGMVDRLSARLASQGGPAGDWARLIHALRVLGNDARAQEIATEAQTTFASDPQALQQITTAMTDDISKAIP